MKNKYVIIAAIIALIIGGAGGFFGGMQYQKSQRTAFFTTNREMMGGQRAFGNGQGNARFGQGRNFTPVMGEITEANDQTITVKMEDGSSKIIVISDKTMINKSSEGTKEDLKAGEKIAAFGSQNSDGSITAQNIQLNPQMRMMQRSDASKTQTN